MHDVLVNTLPTSPLNSTLSPCDVGVSMTILQMRKLRPGEVYRLGLNQSGILVVVYQREWGLLPVAMPTSLPFLDCRWV